MSVQRRKDNKGRVLKTGESQRKDGSYMYRYSDIYGARQCIYASDLKELRDKETEVRKALDCHIDYHAGKITLNELISKYMETKKNLRPKSFRTLKNTAKSIEKHPICNMKIDSIRVSDVKDWIVAMNEKGYAYSTIQNKLALAKVAMNMAIQDCVVLRNPFNVKMASLIVNDTEEITAYTNEEIKLLLDFFKHDKYARRYLNVFIILLGTGLRISELCGLTANDIDVDNMCIHVTHQMIDKDMSVKDYCIGAPKTSSGVRDVPISDDVYKALQDAVRTRPLFIREPIVDGYSGFIFLTTQGNPCAAQRFDRGFKSAYKRFKNIYPQTTITNIRPHRLRHTYCTNLVQKGVDLKTIQYLMGHASIETTLKIYTHTNKEIVNAQISRLPEFNNYKNCLPQKNTA